MAAIAGSRSTPTGGAEADPTSTHPYTCNSCQVAFRNGDLQKGHMKSDWHRYNLNRRVAGLPPISSEVFTEKVIQARATTAAQADKAGFEKVCQVCQKSYYSENSFQNHMSSQKHRAKAAALANGGGSVADDGASSILSSTFSLGEPAVAAGPEVDSDAEEEFSHVIEGLKKANIEDLSSPVKRPSNPHPSAQGQHKQASAEHSERQLSSGTPASVKTPAPASSAKSCLFCNYESPTVALNVAHMERFHGMFIPEKQYLVNIEGLISMLERQVREGFECLFCGKVKADTFAVQTHMRDKAHCKIPYTTIEEQLEIGEFYDFRATYSDSESDGDDEESADDRQGGGAKLGAKRSVITTGQDGGVFEQEDNDWETDSSASSLDSADLTAVPADHHYHQYERLDKHPHHSQTDPRAHHQRDGWHSHAHKHNHAVFYDEYELHLPSGKSVGHRAHNRYFRQNLRHYPSAEERAEHQRLAIAAGEAGGVGLDGESGAVVSTETNSRGRDLLARIRGGRPDNMVAALHSSGQNSALRKLKAQQRDSAKREAKKPTSSFEFRGRGMGLM